MKNKQYRYIVQEYDFRCVNCGARHPTKAERCFICGKIDTTIFDKIKNKEKKKSDIKGATLTINL